MIFFGINYVFPKHYMFWYHRISKIWSYFAILCILDTLLTVERNGDEFFGSELSPNYYFSGFSEKLDHTLLYFAF